MKRPQARRPVPAPDLVEGGSSRSAAEAPGCGDVRDRLDALAARDLPAPLSSVVRQHLLGCVGCRTAYRAALDAAQAFRAATGREFPPASDPAAEAIDAEFFVGLQRDVLVAVGLGPSAAESRQGVSGRGGLDASERDSWCDPESESGEESGSDPSAAFRLRRRLVAAAALLVGLALGAGGAFDQGVSDVSGPPASLLASQHSDSPDGSYAPSSLLTVEPQRGVRGLHGSWQDGFGFDDPSLETAPVSRRVPSDPSSPGVGCGLGASAAAMELVEGRALDLDDAIGQDR